MIATRGDPARSRSSVEAALRWAVPILFFAAAVTLRVRGVSGWFWMLGDQIRDWQIVLGPFRDLPLVGPATHVQGYTIGPAFYWILWGIRVTVGPWFHNLPHAGGIGQAILQSATDTLLLVAIWKRTGSLWVALAAMILVITAPYDLALASLVWNPTMGSTLAKIALALVLLNWHQGSNVRAGVTAGIAWAAVHAYTGAIFVTVSILVVLMLEPLRSTGDGRRFWTRAAAIATVIVALQVPYMAHQVTHGFADSAMGAVTQSVSQVLTGREPARVGASIAGLTHAVDAIQVRPWHVPLTPWILLSCGAVVAVAYRRDPVLLCVTILPQLLAVAGYALFLSGLDDYYYLSLMPSVVLTVVLALSRPGGVRDSTPFAVGLATIAILLVPARVRLAATIHRMPEYASIVAGSRTMAERHQPLRTVQTDFPVLPTVDTEVVYLILGGQLDRTSPWIGVIEPGGAVRYRLVDGL
jgi:hypothetical protein